MVEFSVNWRWGLDYQCNFGQKAETTDCVDLYWFCEASEDGQSKQSLEAEWREDQIHWVRAQWPADGDCSTERCQSHREGRFTPMLMLKFLMKYHWRHSRLPSPRPCRTWWSGRWRTRTEQYRTLWLRWENSSLCGRRCRESWRITLKSSSTR